MLKLHIEMTIADFIAKILKASRMSNHERDINYGPSSSGGPTTSGMNDTWQSSTQPTSSGTRSRSDHATPIEGARVHTRSTVVRNEDRRVSEATQVGRDSESHAQRRWSWVKVVSQSLKSPV